MYYFCPGFPGMSYNLEVIRFVSWVVRPYSQVIGKWKFEFRKTLRVDNRGCVTKIFQVFSLCLTLLAERYSTKIEIPLENEFYQNF